MIAIQKPVNNFFSPPSTHYRPSHCRHPSAPVIVRPTHTPGLLSLSKPPASSVPRPQQPQPHPRAPRSSPKGKIQRSNQPSAAQSVEIPKKVASKPKADGVPTTISTASDKSPRGRQAKSGSKDKADRRSNSLSSRSQARRPSHQPSPPPPSRIPHESDPSTRVVNPLQAHSFARRDNDSNLFDPFLVQSSLNHETAISSTAIAKENAKPVAFPAPQLATRPTGKLARRRQSGGHHFVSNPSTPTPTKASRSKVQSDLSAPLFQTNTNALVNNGRRLPRRVSTVPPMSSWDFPICDDSDDFTPPSTPVRESASVPAKTSGATWQQQVLFIDEAPHTAPLSSAFAFPFSVPSPTSTPTPAQRRRHHRRVPSDGVFSMSMDEGSSSDSSEDSISLHQKRAVVPVRRTPSPSTPDTVPAGYYAGSVFQNSPSPDELPVPAF